MKTRYFTLYIRNLTIGILPFGQATLPFGFIHSGPLFRDAGLELPINRFELDKSMLSVGRKHLYKPNSSKYFGRGKGLLFIA